MYVNIKDPADGNIFKKKPNKNEVLIINPTVRFQIGEISWINRSQNRIRIVPYHKNKKGVDDRAIQKEIRHFILHQTNPFVEFFEFGHILPHVPSSTSKRDSGHWRYKRTLKRLRTFLKISKWRDTIAIVQDKL